MNYLRFYVEVLSIFTVSILLLMTAYAVIGGRYKAYGLGWYHYKGDILLCVGVLYIAVGVALRLMR